MSGIGLDLFPDAPRGKPKFPQGPIMRDALIEDNYRFWLSRAWGPGPSLGIVGLNPSDADAKRDDPTMLREIGFAFRWGFGSLIKFNIYPFISANPDAMRKWLETSDDDHSAREAKIRNMEDAAARLLTVDKIWAAWGNGAEQADLDYLHWALTDDQSRSVTLWCIGRNQNGSPKHTLARGVHRVPDDAELVVWEKWPW